MADPTVSLGIYKAQLKQVNEALIQENDESTVKDLIQLRDDLTQLISLTEESTQQDRNARPRTDNAEESGDPLINDDEVSPPNLNDELSEFYKDIESIEDSEATKHTSDDKAEQSLDGKQGYFDPELSGSSKSLATPELSSSNSDIVNKNLSLDDELTNFYSEISESSNSGTKSRTYKRSESRSDTLNEKFLDSIEDLVDISGVKCQAPFSTDWSGSQYHNAMIKGPVGRENCDDDDDCDIRIKVLFLNPTMKNMRPCPYYLDGSCKFDSTQCRFSHGYIVSIYDLRPYVMPDYTKLEEGSKCLAKMADGLWKPGLIDKIEANFYHIKFLHKDVNLVLELHDLLPQIDHAESDADLSDSDVDIVKEIVSASNIYSKYGDSSFSGEKPSIGLWEEHTKGIGLKLLQKMGYKLGGGLGKLAQGRTEPVAIVVLPRGKSLDHCMKVREEKGVTMINDGVQSLVKGRSNRQKRHRGCVFSFLNKTLGDKNTQVTTSKAVPKPKDMFGIKEGKDKKKTKNYNKEMFKNDEKMKKINAKIQKVQESVRRNQGNASVINSLQQKLAALRKELKNMQEYDSSIKVHKTRMETHRKMTVF